MNSLCYDEYKNLVLEYIPTGDISVDMNIANWLELADFQQQGENWVFPKTKDLVKFISIVKQIKEFFEEEKIELDICESLQNVVNNSVNKDNYQQAVEKGLRVKNECPVCAKTWPSHDQNQLKECGEKITPDISPNFKRKLMPYQKLSISHLLAVGNGANLSVPGSGKTTITYAAISKWLDDGIIDKILVIGPTASFFPWEDEYKLCFGKKPRSIRVRGEVGKQLPNLNHDLFLMHFSTAMHRVAEIIEFMSNNKVMLIIDESHNIKSPQQKTWARTARAIAPFAIRRTILSGTPMPNDARDLWVQITFLWPYDFPLGNDITYMRYAKNHGIGKFKNALDPLFTRIRKRDLDLPKPEFKNHFVSLSPVQAEIYNVIVSKTLEEIYDMREKAKLQRFRVAKMIRLLQAASNPTLIYEKSDEFDVTNEEFGVPKQKVSLTSIKHESPDTYEKIVSYSSKEIPAKLVEATKLAKELLAKGEKVIIWSSFVTNMEIFENQLLKEERPILIYGDVSKDEEDEDNRDKRIQEFKDDPNPRILIATPASLAESVSLHINSKTGEKVCSNAIYLDRNFNGAQFMQSMDRIHRLGMAQDTKVTYHLIIGKRTIDEKIDERLWQKFTDMSNALNDSWPTILDYDGTREEISKEEAQKDFNALVDHLKELKKDLEKEDGN